MQVYVELLVRHYSEKEVVVLLKDIAKQVQRRMTAENFTLEMRTGLLDDLEGIVEVKWIHLGGGSFFFFFVLWFAYAKNY